MNRTIHETERPAVGEKSGDASEQARAHAQRNSDLHSTLYHLLHTAVAPTCPGIPRAPAALVTNGLGCLPIVVEDGAYIIKND